MSQIIRPEPSHMKKEFTIRGDHPFIFFEAVALGGDQHMLMMLQEFKCDGVRVSERLGHSAYGSALPAAFTDGAMISNNMAKDNLSNAIATMISGWLNLVVSRDTLLFRQQLQPWQDGEIVWELVDQFIASLVKPLFFIKTYSKLEADYFSLRIVQNGKWEPIDGKNRKSQMLEHIQPISVKALAEEIEHIRKTLTATNEEINAVFKQRLISQLTQQIYSLQAMQAFDLSKKQATIK